MSSEKSVEMHLIDTHVHLNFDSLASDLDAVRQRWQQAGVVRLVHSCVHPGEFSAIQAIADRVPELSFAVGLHPLDTEKWTAHSADQIVEFARSDSRVVAIGEMGLDFYKADDQSQQEKIFEAQLEIAHHLNKPVIVHCRDAAAPMYKLLKKFWERQGPVSGVMHCWGGTPEETQWFLDLGFYISFSGIVTFKSAKPVHASARQVRSDRLLIETDCPFLAPVPRRGKRNEPAYVQYVADALAKLRNVPLETIAQQTAKNACQLFDLSLEAEPQKL